MNILVRLCLAMLFAAPATAGSLLIVGGALDPSNAPVHRALMDGRPEGAPVIAIIPSASGYPADSARRFAETLIRHGARAQDIIVVHLAAEDDPTTPDIDESRWAGNASDAAEIAKLASAGAIWFTGGDQLRTTSLLVPDGRESPMLAAIRSRLAAGAIIGGSSAGAAIMSKTMISEGDPMAALLDPVARRRPPDNSHAGGTPLVLEPGLGFLPSGLVDQHFDARRRLGRLTRALFELAPADRFGFGIDENSALKVDLANGTAEVLGAATVVVVDARQATPGPGARFAADGMTLSVASHGDRIALPSLAIIPAVGRSPLAPQPPRSAPIADSGGFGAPQPPLGQAIADGFLRQPARQAHQFLGFRQQDGIHFRFHRRPDTRTFESAGHLTLAGLGYAIRPLTLNPEPLP